MDEKEDVLPVLCSIDEGNPSPAPYKYPRRRATGLVIPPDSQYHVMVDSILKCVPTLQLDIRAPGPSEWNSRSRATATKTTKEKKNEPKT